MLQDRPVEIVAASRDEYPQVVLGFGYDSVLELTTSNTSSQ